MAPGKGMLKGWLTSLLALPAFGQACLADGQWHGQLVVASDYLCRGYSKNRGTPLVQGRLDYQDASGWVAGAGVSQASFDDRHYKNYADAEIKPYLGWSLPLAAGWRGEVMAAGYIFDGKIFGKAADYAEFSQHIGIG